MDLARHLKQHNPYVQTTSYGRIENHLDALYQSMEESDLTIVAVGNDNVEQFINRVAVELKRDVIFGYTLQKARVGRIMKVIPYQTACRECLKQYKLRSGSHWIDIPTVPDDEIIYDHGCAFPSMPGAGIDTDFVSNLMARLTVQHLLETSDDNNHWLWVSEGLAELAVDERLQQNMQLISQKFAPIPDCSVCGDDVNA